MGLFYPFLDDKDVEIRVEVVGKHPNGLHAASLTGGKPGILHGNAPICCKMMARLQMHTPFQPGLITPALGLNIHGCTILAGSIMSAPPMMKPWLLFSFAPAKRALFLPSNHRMRLLMLALRLVTCLLIRS